MGSVIKRKESSPMPQVCLETIVFPYSAIVGLSNSVKSSVRFACVLEKWSGEFNQLTLLKCLNR